MSGVRIITSEFMADQVIDTSGCRSPSRALRRLRRGIRGRVAISYVPWTHAMRLPNGHLVMHPATYAQVARELDRFSLEWAKPTPWWQR